MQDRSTNFAIVGSAATVAKRHVGAIRKNLCHLECVYDPKDVVEVHWNENCERFSNFELFQRHINDHITVKNKPGILAVCSPNSLHKAHCLFGISQNLDVICEKPIAIHPNELFELEDIASRAGRRIYSVQQLRYHPAVMAFRSRVLEKKAFHQVVVDYILPRPNSFFRSWNVNSEVSGGLPLHIGIHIFDILCWVFGNVTRSIVFLNEPWRASGFLEFESASVTWYLSTPLESEDRGKVGEFAHGKRTLWLDGEPFSLDGMHYDLYSEVYKNVLDGKGIRLADVKSAVCLAHQITHSVVTKLPAKSLLHPRLQD